MRSQEEIKQRFEERKQNDLLGFEAGEYIDYLEYENAKPYLKEGVTEEQWKEVHKPATKEVLKERMLDYMSFAWDKANNMRGISANRSIMHFIAWLWLAEEDELLAKVEEAFTNNYHYYGKPILEMICDHYGWDWKQWDDGERTNG